MKKATYALVSLALCFTGCKSTSIQEKSGSTPIPGIDTAKQYLDECTASETNPSLGLFGWNEVTEYQNSVPKLKALRDVFEEADEALDNAFMQDAEYRAAYDEYEDSTDGYFNQEKYDEFGKVYSLVRSRLMQDAEFRQTRKTRDKTLLVSNIQTLEYIINDYERQEKEFPVDWIAKATKNDTWMPDSKFRVFVEHLGRNEFWKDRYWVAEVSGRSNKNGKIEYKVKYEPVPSEGRYEWYWWFCMDEEHFDEKKKLYAATGLEMVHDQFFVLQSGEKRYQAVWHKHEIQTSKDIL